MRSENFSYGTKNWLIRALLITTMKLSENFWKTDEKHSRPNIVRTKQKTLPLKILSFWKISSELSVSSRQTAGDSYLTEYPTVLVPHFSQFYFLKHAKI